MTPLFFPIVRSIALLSLHVLTNVLLPSNLNTLFSAVTCLNMFVYSSYWQFLNNFLVIFWGKYFSVHLICSFVFMLSLCPFLPLQAPQEYTKISLWLTEAYFFLHESIQKIFLRKGLDWKIGDVEPGHCVALSQKYNLLDLSCQVQNEEDPARWSISKVMTTLKPNDSLALWFRTSHLDAICFIEDGWPFSW